MRIRLFHKLFGAFVLTSLLIVGLMISILRFYVSGSFFEYVGKMELERHRAIITELGDIYRKSRGWESLRRNRRLWTETIAGIVAREIPDSLKRMPDSQFPPDMRLPPDIRLPPYSGRFPPDMPSSPNMRPYRELGGKLDGKPPRDGWRRGLRGRIFHMFSLFDEHKRPVVGSAGSADRFFLKVIEIDGHTVGWLGMRKPSELYNPLDISFLKQQTRFIYLVGGGILLLALFVAFVLSRHLLSPVRFLTEGAQAISHRRFDTRIKVNTSDELGRLADDFNRMAETLEKFEEQRKQWITDITHELGTPLSILRGEIEALQDGIRELSLERLTSLHSEVIHLSKIVNDLRELSLVETGGLSFRKVTVNPLHIAKETCNVFQVRFSSRNIRLETDLDAEKRVVVDGDVDRLQQVYSNIMENSLRYTHTPGTLKIGHAFTPDGVTIFFEDSGPGVPEASLEHLFDRLYRVEKSRSRAEGGSGLGLAICKHIVEAHDGMISAMNAPGGGLRIEIVIPTTDTP
ncbi:MAG: HAMP domain-containing protein [Proteobacteria bacterium]|nr:HAMP domain-containing protein [Pseudomonadota bacterium]